MTSSELDALSNACVVNKIKIRFDKNPYKEVEDAIYEQMNAPLILRNNSLICEIDLSKHDSELLDKVVYRINQRKESNKICLQNALNKNDKEDAQYFRNLLFEDDLVTDIIAELKVEVNQ